jgi:ATP/maltotriose-dependent transcriptional regulator MalT
MAAAEHRNLAYVELRDGNLERARALVGEARARREGLDYPALDAYLALDDATLAAAGGDLQRAAEHLQSAMQMFDQLGVIPDPDDEVEIARLRRQIGATEDRPAN